MQPKQISLTLSEVARITEASLHGDPDCKIYRISPLEKAQPGDICFLSNAQHLNALRHTKASAVILSSSHLKECPTHALVHEHPVWSYTKLAELFLPSPHLKPSIHPTVVIGKNCTIDPTVSIGAHCVIGDSVTIGANTVIHSGCTLGEGVTLGTHVLFWPRVVIYHDVVIGNRVIIHSGAVIGSDGFGNIQHQGAWVKIPQLGSVHLGDDVEIGANTTIDRGAIEDTVIGNGVKIDNQVQIAHNVTIGDHTAIAACVGIAGSARVGKSCMIGGSVNVLGHISIADHAIIAGASNVGRSIDKPDFYLSSFSAVPHLKWKKNLVRFYQLDELTKRLLKLEKSVCEK